MKEKTDGNFDGVSEKFVVVFEAEGQSV